jgi:DNA polymerase Ligase (LigD)
MARFVILEHDWPTRHWDFFLESGQVLRAWRLLDEPAPGSSVASEPSAEHRRLYLEYEGPVSGDRGHVLRWDAGTFEWIADAPGRIEIELKGERLRGRVVIETTRTRFE